MNEQLKCRFLGQVYPLTCLFDESVKKDTIVFDQKTFTCLSPDLHKVDANKALKTFYKRQAKKIIDKRLKVYQGQIKKSYKSFSIESHPGRWGSCSSERVLTFNWMLMLFPMEAIDYVVIHELCHLQHLNHDRSFWRLVGKLCPNYKEIMPLLGTKKTRDL